MTTTPCCAHRGLDHVHREGGPQPGSACTLPGCKCPGWIPRPFGGKRANEQAQKIRALYAEGLTPGEIRERLGVSESCVSDALRSVKKRAKSKRGTVRRAQRATVADCLSGFGR